MFVYTAHTYAARWCSGSVATFGTEDQGSHAQQISTKVTQA